MPGQMEDGWLLLLLLWNEDAGVVLALLQLIPPLLLELPQAGVTDESLAACRAIT